MLAVVNVKLVSNFSVVGFGSNIVGSIECKLLFLQISVLTEKILCPKGKRKTDLIIFASFLNDTFLQCLMPSESSKQAFNICLALLVVSLRYFILH